VPGSFSVLPVSTAKCLIRNITPRPDGLRRISPTIRAHGSFGPMLLSRNCRGCSRPFPARCKCHGRRPRRAVDILRGPSSGHFQKATESGAVIRDNGASTPRGHASPITLTVIGFPACTVHESYSR
jgi:hypothetical protein